ncbi:sugar transporter SWEET1-like [Oryctolagus cuniculus]|uniref:sugar transporter SWEET1-like n=1 Tax=Oryctolagus cuniculus TaxID=9986 RepID=UPI003878FF41
MFSIGLSDLRHVQMTRSVDSIQFLPFLTTDVNNLGWLSYGTMKGDGLLMSVNAVGAVLQTLCILVSPLYCPQKPAVLLPTTSLLRFLLQGYAYLWLPCLTPRPGFSCVFTISMYLSLLADVAKVIQTKSTKRLSFSRLPPWSLYGFRL